MKKNLKGEKQKITFHFLCISIYFSHSDELDRGFCDIFEILRIFRKIFDSRNEKDCQQKVKER